jgi:hypothetical protein
MANRFGVFCTPKPVQPVGHWMNDGDQDGDRWEGTREQADQAAGRLRKLHPDLDVEVLPITET